MEHQVFLKLLEHIKTLKTIEQINTLRQLVLAMGISPQQLYSVNAAINSVKSENQLEK